MGGAVPSGRLAVLVAARGSLSPAQIAAAAADLPVLFVLDERAEGPDADRLSQVAEALADTVYADFARADACAEAIRACGGHYVTTFVDRLCALADDIRRRLGHAPGSPQRWGRKDEQRRVLADAGVSRIRSALLRDPADVQNLLRRWRTAVVVKPVNGVASANTWLVRTADDAAALVADLDRAGADGVRLFAEEYVRGTPREASHLADYVSVEVVNRGTAAGHAPLAFITDRSHLAWPCRETGLFWPTSLDPATERRVIASAHAALDALDAGCGSYHVELKPGAGHNEIIEVNGRLGGFMAQAVTYGGDVDVARLALTASAGLARGAPSAIRWRRCVALLMFPPPTAARRILRAPSRRAMLRLTGVLAVEEASEAGARFHWRDGTGAAVALVWLAADDHDTLRARFLDAAEYLSAAYGFADENGHPVHDDAWLAKLRGGPSAVGSARGNGTG